MIRTELICHIFVFCTSMCWKWTLFWWFSLVW